MARESAGWRHYAQAQDDLRHRLVDQAWFGQHHRDHAVEADVHRMERKEPEPPPPDPERNRPPDPNGLEGIGTRGDETSNWEAVKSAAHARYEQDQEAGVWDQEAPEPLDPDLWDNDRVEAELGQLYGEARPRDDWQEWEPTEAELAEFYGWADQDPASAQDLYGYQEEEADAEALYGQASPGQAQTADLYGTPADQQPEMADLYGQPEQEMEP